MSNLNEKAAELIEDMKHMASLHRTNGDTAAADEFACGADLVRQLMEENEALSHWRDLALQFDNHRMAALWHLKRLVVDPQSQSCAELFLREPPMAAHEVVVERDQLKADVERLNAELDEAKQFQPIGEACLANRDTLRASLGLKLGDNLHEHVEALRKDAGRYQWLRDKSQAVHQFYLSVPLWFTGVRFRTQDVDNAIDAMSKGEQP